MQPAVAATRGAELRLFIAKRDRPILPSGVIMKRNAVYVFIFVAGLLTSLPPSSADTLYVSNGVSDTIEEFATDGGGGTVFASTLLHTPSGLAIDAAGNVYAANVTNTISKFTPAGAGTVFANTGLDNPQGLAFDGDGNLYAANASDNTIEKYAPDGTPSVFAADPGDHSLLYQPEGLAVDGDGNLYVSNLTFIEKFTPAGVGSLFVNGTLMLHRAWQLTAVATCMSPIATIIRSQSSIRLGHFWAPLPLAIPNWPSLRALHLTCAGNLYAANVIPSIEAFTPTGIASAFASDPGDHSVLDEPLFIAIVPEPSAHELVCAGHSGDALRGPGSRISRSWRTSTLHRPPQAEASRCASRTSQ